MTQCISQGENYRKDLVAHCISKRVMASLPPVNSEGTRYLATTQYPTSMLTQSPKPRHTCCDPSATSSSRSWDNNPRAIHLHQKCQCIWRAGYAWLSIWLGILCNKCWGVLRLIDCCEYFLRLRDMIVNTGQCLQTVRAGGHKCWGP